MISSAYVGNSFFTSNGGDWVRDSGRERDGNQLFLNPVALVRELPLHWFRKFVLEDLEADEMSKAESFEIPPTPVKLIRSDVPDLATLSPARTCQAVFPNY